jgi:hypothetical protein
MELGWRESVLNAIHRSATKNEDGLISRKMLFEQELPTIIMETKSVGQTPAQTLSRVLQELRTEGEIEFVENGVYRRVTNPIDVETVDLEEEDLDSRIRRNLLSLGNVVTSDETALARRRRGQDRIRALTLRNYETSCAICDVRERSLLIASHIVPWSESSESRGDLTNVICLCRLHDPLFENGFWSLGDDFEVLVKPNVKAWAINAVLPSTVQFSRPAVFAPNLDFVSRHRERHRFYRE